MADTPDNPTNDQGEVPGSPPEVVRTAPLEEITGPQEYERVQRAVQDLLRQISAKPTPTGFAEAFGGTRIQAVQVHTELGGGYADVGYLVDASGKQFVACCNSVWNDNNITFVDLYVVPPGAPFPSSPTYQIYPVDKLDRAAIFNSGRDLFVTCLTHSIKFPGGTARPVNIEQARIPGIFTVTASYTAERGGVGAVIVPQDPGPGPTPVPVDYARIKTDTTEVVQNVVGASVSNSLAHQIIGPAQQSLRQALRDDLDQDALLHLLTGTGDKDKAYQAALFEFTKNAAANVPDNILFERDAWGVTHHAALVKAIEEGCTNALRAAGLIKG